MYSVKHFLVIATHAQSHSLVILLSISWVAHLSSFSLQFSSLYAPPYLLTREYLDYTREPSRYRWKRWWRRRRLRSMLRVSIPYFTSQQKSYCGKWKAKRDVRWQAGRDPMADHRNRLSSSGRLRYRWWVDPSICSGQQLFGGRQCSLEIFQVLQ